MPAAIRGLVSRGSHCLGSNKFVKGLLESSKVRDEGLKLVETTTQIGESIVKMPFCGAGDRGVQWAENAHTWAVIARGGSGIWFNGLSGVKKTFDEANKTIDLADKASEIGRGGKVFFDGHSFDSRAEWLLGVASRACRTASQALFALAFGVCQLIRLPVLIDKLRDRDRFPNALNYPEPFNSIAEAFGYVMVGRSGFSAAGSVCEGIREWKHYNNGGAYYCPYKRENSLGVGAAHVKWTRAGYQRINDANERLDEFVRRMINHICSLLDSLFKGTATLFTAAHLEAVHPVFGVLAVIFNVVSVVFGGIKLVREL